MTACLLGLGTNLGDRARNLDRAVKEVGARDEIHVEAVSNYRPTAPVGGPGGQDEFLNAALRLQTSLTPAELMQHLLRVEQTLGRRRLQRWGPRIIDLDILLFGEICRDVPELQIPHPRMAFRRFVLQPAAEIAADMVHPEIQWTVAQLLEHLNTAIPYVAVTGLPKSGKTNLAEAVATRCGANLIRDPLAPFVDKVTEIGDLGDESTHRTLLQLRLETLRRDGPVGAARESVSDFWFDQTRAHAETWLSDTERLRYRGGHEAAAGQVVPPKLLVRLETTPGESWARLGSAGPDAVGWDERRLCDLEHQLEQLASIPKRQPVLRVSGTNFGRATDEVVAAFETMR